MTNDIFFSEEDFWDAILSRQPALIRKACETLSEEERQALLAHLRRMTSEPGWHPEQTASALAALQAFEKGFHIKEIS
jgi:hypothetical protein